MRKETKELDKNKISEKGSEHKFRFGLENTTLIM